MRARSVPPSTIRGTLLVLIALALAPLVLFGVYEVVDEYHDQRDLEVRASAELARTTANAFEAFLHSILRTADAIAVSISLHHREPSEIQRELAGVVAGFPMVRDMSWIDAKGTIVATTEPQLAGKSMFARPYYQEIVAGAEWRVSPLIQSLVDARPTFIVARAVRSSSGALVGIVAAAVDAERIVPLLGQRSGGGVTSLVDSAGTLVAIQPPIELDWAARRRTAEHAWVQRALAGEEALGVFRSPVTGGRRVGAIVPVRSVGWAASASRPIEDALGPVRRGAVLNAAALAGVALLSLLAALVVTRRIAAPLRALESYATSLGTDAGPGPVPARGPAEVRRVARALEAMAASLAARREELEAAGRAAEAAAAAAEEHGAEMEALVAALPVGLVIVDPAQKVLRMNGPARALAGLSPPDAHAPPGRRFLAADGRPLAADEEPVSRALRGEVVQGVVVRVEREQCHPVWLAVSAAPIRDHAGAIRGAVATSVDLTEVRDLQEERETLMQTVSHDLRTPLHVVVAHAEILRRRGDEESRRRAEAILASAGRMTRLIGDLVDAARLEAGHVPLDLEPLDLAVFVARWKDRMAGALEVERVRIRVPDAVPVVMADPARLDQILANLVSNALKYSVADSEVGVELHQEDASQLRLCVIDRGPGIDPEELPRIFERYYRAKSASRAEGLGLGLFITRKLVEALGWRIEVSSKPGKGTTFTIVIPLAGGEAAQSTAA